MFRPVRIIFLIASFHFFFLQTSFAQTVDSSFRVDSIHVQGNRKTKTAIILRELSFASGDTIQNWAYHSEQSRRQLINLFLFNEIKLSRDGNTVHIDVTERWYIWPIPELDYADRNFNQWWLSKDPRRLIYGINLEWYNMRGRNETMVLSLISGYTRMAAFSYRIPYFNKKQSWGVQMSAHYSSNKEVWYKTENDKVQFFRDNDRDLIKRRNAEVIFTHRKKIFTYHHFFAGYRQTSIADTVATYEVNQNYLLYNQNSQREQYLGYQFVYDKRDFKGFPLQGTLVKLNIEGSNYDFTAHDFQTLMLKASVSKYVKLAQNLFGSANITARYYSNTYPQYSRIQALGYGKDYIRGYELFVIDGNHFGLGKAELKYRFLNRKFSFLPGVRNYGILPVSLFISSFFDYAYVNNNTESKTLVNSNHLPNSWQHGGGCGLNIVMFYDYCARIEYSFDKQLNNRFYLSFVAAM